MLSLSVNTQAGPGANGKPETSGGSAICGLVAIDQAEARLALVALDIEPDSTTVGQLRMATHSHQLAGVRIRLALQKQLGDPTLQPIGCGEAR